MSRSAGLGQALQVVQAAVEVDDVGLLADDPLVEVGEHVGAVAAVGRWADDNRLAGQPFGEVESVKAVSDLYSPVDGEVIAVHSDLAQKLETLASDPYNTGWMIKVALGDESSLKKLMDAAAYERQCASEG